MLVSRLRAGGTKIVKSHYVRAHEVAGCVARVNFEECLDIFFDVVGVDGTTRSSSVGSTPQPVSSSLCIRTGSRADPVIHPVGNFEGWGPFPGIKHCRRGPMTTPTPLCVVLIYIAHHQASPRLVDGRLVLKWMLRGVWLL